MVWSHILRILPTFYTHSLNRSIGLGSVALSEYDLLGEALEENKSAAGGVGANVLPLLQVNVVLLCVVRYLFAVSFFENDHRCRLIVLVRMY